MVLRPPDVVDLTRLKVVNDICERLARVGHIGGGPVMAEIDLIRQVLQGTVDKDANHAAVRRVVLAGSVRVEQAHADGLRVMHCG